MKKKEEKKPKEVKKEEDGEEDEEKAGSGVLSDSVLDAFDNETVPVADILEDDPLFIAEDEDDEDMLDSGDYKISDEW